MIMISLQQCKHVIEYYVQKICQGTIHVMPHIQRDCVFLNKERGKMCAIMSKHDNLSKIITLLHQATLVEQINTVPQDTICFIDDTTIPKNNGGVQLILHMNEIKHICIQKKYQKICYAYYKIRHFTTFVEDEIKKWLLRQEWYIPKMYRTSTIVDRVLASHLPQHIYTHLVNAINTVNAN